MTIQTWPDLRKHRVYQFKLIFYLSIIIFTLVIIFYFYKDKKNKTHFNYDFQEKVSKQKPLSQLKKIINDDRIIHQNNEILPWHKNIDKISGGHIKVLK